MRKLAWVFLIISLAFLIFLTYSFGIFDNNKIIVTAEGTTNPGYRLVIGEHKLAKLIPDSLKKVKFVYDYIGVKGLAEPYSYANGNDMPWDYYFVIKGYVVERTEEMNGGYWYPVFYVENWWRINKYIELIPSVIISSLLIILSIVLFKKSNKL